MHFTRSNNTRIIKVLDHLGEVHPATQFSITLNGQTQNLSSNAEGILDLTSTAGQAIELRWLGNPHPGESTALPVMCLYETGDSAAPGDFFKSACRFRSRSPAVIGAGKLVCFAQLRAGYRANARFHTRSRVEPLTDGFKAFKLIAADMINCVPSNPPRQMTCPVHILPVGVSKNLCWMTICWMTDGKPFTYAGLVKHLIDHNSDVRALVNKLFSVPGDLDDAAQQNAILLVVIITDIVS